jgi:hypothetical protein
VLMKERQTLFHQHLESRAVRKIRLRYSEAVKFSADRSCGVLGRIRSIHGGLKSQARIRIPDLYLKRLLLFILFYFLAVLKTLEHPGPYFPTSDLGY